MKQHAPLQERKSSLSVGTAFDPLHLIDEPLDHPIAPRHAASVGNCLRIISEPINKRDQFRNSTGPDSSFPLLQPLQPLAFSEQTAKVLRQMEHDGDRLVALYELVQIGGLLWGTVLCRPHHHERNASGRRRLVPDDGLLGNRACDFLTKGTKPHLKRSPRTCVPLSNNFLVQPGDIVAPLVPARSQIGKVGINNGGRARSSSQRWRCFLYPNLRDFTFARQGKLQDATDNGFGGGGHAKEQGDPCCIGSIGGYANGLKSLDEPISHPCVALDHFWEALGKDTLGTGCLTTDPLAHP